MNRFAELLDRLAFEPSRNNKLKLLAAYFRAAGDPDRGFDVKQPGGWAFNILPHVEQSELRELGTGMTDVNAKADQVTIRVGTPVAIFACASRRPAASSTGSRPAAWTPRSW